MKFSQFDFEFTTNVFRFVESPKALDHYENVLQLGEMSFCPNDIPLRIVPDT